MNYLGDKNSGGKLLEDTHVGLQGVLSFGPEESSRVADFWL
jgi:hypothetical protein